jgi:hypothetical protein
MLCSTGYIMLCSTGYIMLCSTGYIMLCSTGYIMLTLIASIYSLLLFASFCYSYEFGVHRTVIVLVGFTTTYAISEYHQWFNKVMSSNSGHGEVYSIQHYVIKFVSDLRFIWIYPYHTY